MEGSSGTQATLCVFQLCRVEKPLRYRQVSFSILLRMAFFHKKEGLDHVKNQTLFTSSAYESMAVSPHSHVAAF
jgi:hypothetical protein